MYDIYCANLTPHSAVLVVNASNDVKLGFFSDKQRISDKLDIRNGVVKKTPHAASIAHNPGFKTHDRQNCIYF